METTDKVLLVKGLAEKAESATRQSPPADAILREGGDENHRKPPAIGDKAILQIDAADARHLHIGNDAGRVVELRGT